MAGRVHFDSLENMRQRIVETPMIGNCQPVIMIAGRVIGIQFQCALGQFDALLVIATDVVGSAQRDDCLGIVGVQIICPLRHLMEKRLVFGPLMRIFV